MLRLAPLLTLALIVSPLASVSAAEFVPSTRGKKLISYGSDWPNTVYVRQHVREMEKQPFDGIVIGVSQTREPQTNGETLGIRCWTKEKFDPKLFEPALEDLKAIKFEKFKDNFIQVETMPGDVDWFDDDQFGAVAHNFKILARVAHEGG